MNGRPLPQVFLGILIVAAGVVALLGQLGLVEVSLGEIISDWWPMVIVAVGLAALISVPRAWLGPTLVFLVGVLLQLSELDLVDIDLWGFIWPIAIILVGLSLLTRMGTRGEDDEVVNSAVVWWGSQRRTTSQRFRGGSLTAIMGGIEVDLRGAGIVDRAEVAVFTWWGGVEIKVPPTWRVEVSGLPVLGGWDDKTAHTAGPDAPVLVVHVTAIMGGLEIKN